MPAQPATTTTGITADDFDPNVTHVHVYCLPQDAIALHEHMLTTGPQDVVILRNSIAHVLTEAAAGEYLTTLDEPVRL